MNKILYFYIRDVGFIPIKFVGYFDNGDALITLLRGSNRKWHLSCGEVLRIYRGLNIRVKPVDILVFEVEEGDFIISHRVVSAKLPELTAKNNIEAIACKI